MPGTPGSGVPEYHFLSLLTLSIMVSLVTQAVCCVKLKQIPSFGFYNLFIRASSCLIPNP